MDLVGASGEQLDDDSQHACEPAVQRCKDENWRGSSSSCDGTSVNSRAYSRTQPENLMDKTKPNCSSIGPSLLVSHPQAPNHTTNNHDLVVDLPDFSTNQIGNLSLVRKFDRTAITCF
jgi:hypothetical protein